MPDVGLSETSELAVPSDLAWSKVEKAIDDLEGAAYDCGRQLTRSKVVVAKRQAALDAVRELSPEQARLLAVAYTRLEVERDRLRQFAEWVAAHKLVRGTYADDEHPYDEWVTPEGDEMDFVQIHERAREALNA